jgi:hypothetical protein
VLLDAGDDQAGSDAATPVADGPAAPPPLVDLDGDGLDDAREAEIAAAYLPFIATHPDDGCSLSGLVYRVRPHPADPALLFILYDQLYQRDCGTFGHGGDNEAFGVTVDPAVPAPAGILAIRAIAHQGTLCGRTTDCGRCPGQTPCDTVMVEGQAFPVLYRSRDKHGGYTSIAACESNCFDNCAAASAAHPTRPPLVNAGEPGAPVTRDLTSSGLITPAAGWSDPDLMGVDPWDRDRDFGGAGNIAGDLDDPAFVTPACRP